MTTDWNFSTKIEQMISIRLAIDFYWHESSFLHFSFLLCNVGGILFTSEVVCGQILEECGDQ